MMLMNIWKKKEIFTVHNLVMVTKNSFTLTKINGKALGDDWSTIVEGLVASHVMLDEINVIFNET